MANKKELADELEQITGQPVDPEAFTRDELDAAIAEAKASAPQDDAIADQAPQQGEGDAPAADDAPSDDTDAGTEPNEGDDDVGDDDAPDPDELVAVVLGKDAPVGRLLVGRAAIERHQPGRTPARITRAEFEQHKGPYKLEMPASEPEPNPSLAKQLEHVEKGS